MESSDIEVKIPKRYDINNNPEYNGRVSSLFSKVVGVQNYDGLLDYWNVSQNGTYRGMSSSDSPIDYSMMIDGRINQGKRTGSVWIIMDKDKKLHFRSKDFKIRSSHVKSGGEKIDGSEIPESYPAYQEFVQLQREMYPE